MSQIEIGKRLPNTELRHALNGAVNYAQRLRESEVHEVHAFRSLVSTPSVQNLELQAQLPELTKNSIDLAYRDLFGKGAGSVEQEPPFSARLISKLEDSLDKAAEAGRQANPVDMLDLILENPSSATELVIEKALETRNSVQETNIKNPDVADPTLHEIRKYTLKASRRGKFEVTEVFDMKYTKGPIPQFTPAGLIRVHRRLRKLR